MRWEGTFARGGRRKKRNTLAWVRYNGAAHVPLKSAPARDRRGIWIPSNSLNGFLDLRESPSRRISIVQPFLYILLVCPTQTHKHTTLRASSAATGRMYALRAGDATTSLV